MLSQAPRSLPGLPSALQPAPSVLHRPLPPRPVCRLGLGEGTRALSAVPGPCSALTTRRVLVVAFVVREERVSVLEPQRARAKMEFAGRCSPRGSFGIPGGRGGTQAWVTPMG